jgi:hypothetical protein
MSPWTGYVSQNYRSSDRDLKEIFADTWYSTLSTYPQHWQSQSKPTFPILAEKFFYIFLMGFLGIFSFYVCYLTSVADPDPGLGGFLTPGSGIRDGRKKKVSIRIRDPG